MPQIATIEVAKVAERANVALNTHGAGQAEGRASLKSEAVKEWQSRQSCLKYWIGERSYGLSEACDGRECAKRSPQRVPVKGLGWT